MKKIEIILSILLLITTGCGQKAVKQANTSNNGKVSQTIIDDMKPTEINQSIPPDFKTLEFDFGFKVTVGDELDFESFKTYTYFKLERNNKLVYLDKLINIDGRILCTEYQFGNKLFPIILQTGSNSFELLFEVNNRPNKNYLKRLFVGNDKLVEQDKLPAFEASPIDINNDGIKEYAGFWDHFEVYGDNLTTYNPILYYSVTANGLKLDSLLTKQRNEIIYGQFYGFSFDEKNAQPISVIEKFGQELKIIRGGR